MTTPILLLYLNSKSMSTSSNPMINDYSLLGSAPVPLFNDVTNILVLPNPAFQAALQNPVSFDDPEDGFLCDEPTAGAAAPPVQPVPATGQR